MHLDCLGLGIAPLDILYTVESYPRKGSKIDALSGEVHGGGPVPNAMVGLSRLGLKTSLITAMGNDPFGTLSIAELKKENVNCTHVVRKAAPSAIAFGMIEKRSGSRTMVLDRQLFVRPDDLELTKYPKPRLVHLDGRDLDACIKLAKWARRVGAITVFDIGTMRNDVSPIFPFIDHLVVADSYALPFTRKNTERKATLALAKLCPGEIVITSGIRGSLGYSNGTFYSHRAFSVKTLDTTGAGDAFHAGYIFALLRGIAMAERLKYGAAVAALKCIKSGGRTGLPSLRKLNAFLKKKQATYA